MPRLLAFFFLAFLYPINSQSIDTFGAETADAIAAGGDNAPALTKVTLKARVGVLLDEIPNNPSQQSPRDDLVDLLKGKNNPWWRKRAEMQIDLTGYRLTYRAYYHNGNRFQLALPDHDQWSFEWDTEQPKRENWQGHNLFSRNYTMTTYILSTHESIRKSERTLKDIGAEWRELFTLPIDPFLLFQRTGYACIDEGQYPPGTADAEKMEYLFDDTCEVETEIVVGKLGCEGCHCTPPLPQMTCIDALRDKVGSIEVEMKFKRIAYDAGIAAQVRTPDATANGADLTPSQVDLTGTRIIYRYFPPNGCELTVDERCVGASGWRRLLYFDSVDKNVGLMDLDMKTTEFVKDGIKSTPPTQEIAHGLYEYSSCHKHYHFRHFGEFIFQTAQASNTSKRGFCVASVNRWANAEWSPTWSDFSTCETQGITSGWSDVYQAGIACQWIDITDLPQANSGTMSSETNFDGLLCEGKLQTNPDGSQIWQPTPFTTLSGNPVEKQKCNKVNNWDANNKISVPVVLPGIGGSYVTQPCLQSDQHFGPLRNCEFDKVTNPLVRTCVAGQQKSLTCKFTSSKKYQVLRVCEASTRLGTGVACRHQDAIQNILIESGQTGTTFQFTCPVAKSGDSAEIGGSYSLYTAALMENNPATVTCS